MQKIISIHTENLNLRHLPVSGIESSWNDYINTETSLAAAAVYYRYLTQTPMIPIKNRLNMQLP